VPCHARSSCLAVCVSPCVVAVLHCVLVTGRLFLQSQSPYRLASQGPIVPAVVTGPYYYSAHKSRAAALVQHTVGNPSHGLSLPACGPLLCYTAVHVLACVCRGPGCCGRFPQALCSAMCAARLEAPHSPGRTQSDVMRNSTCHQRWLPCVGLCVPGGWPDPCSPDCKDPVCLPTMLSSLLIWLGFMQTLDSAGCSCGSSATSLAAVCKAERAVLCDGV
jgi:hypothetical protein